MAYRYKRKVILLRWGEDERLHELEILARALSVDDVVRLEGLVDKLGVDPARSPVSTKAAEALFDEFAPYIKSWNMEDDETGEPIPATAASLRAALDFDDATDIIVALVKAATGRMTPPLPPPSPGGGTTAMEASIPMETLSASPGS